MDFKKEIITNAKAKVRRARARKRNSCVNIADKTRDQAIKSIGWMPWHQEPKKDVVSCDKPWSAASRQ
jgi:hypothetical protein